MVQTYTWVNAAATFFLLHAFQYLAAQPPSPCFRNQCWVSDGKRVRNVTSPVTQVPLPPPKMPRASGRMTYSFDFWSKKEMNWNDFNYHKKGIESSDCIFQHPTRQFSLHKVQGQRHLTSTRNYPWALSGMVSSQNSLWRVLHSQQVNQPSMEVMTQKKEMHLSKTSSVTIPQPKEKEETVQML